MPLAELKGANIWYELNGPPEAPVIVFSNSLGANLSMWTEQAVSLEAQFRILRYDVRGHGTSSNPESPWTIADLGGDLIDLLDHLGIDTVHFCGVSMGGLTGMWLATNVPERLHRIVLSNTAAKIGTEATWSGRIEGIERGGLEGVVDGVMKRWFTHDFLRDHVRLIAAREMFLGNSRTGYLRCCNAIQSADYRALISQIRSPTLIIAGTQDPMTTTADARFLEQTIPAAAYTELRGSHLTNIEFPQEYSRVLTRFFSR